MAAPVPAAAQRTCNQCQQTFPDNWFLRANARDLTKLLLTCLRCRTGRDPPGGAPVPPAQPAGVPPIPPVAGPPPQAAAVPPVQPAAVPPAQPAAQAPGPGPVNNAGGDPNNNPGNAALTKILDLGPLNDDRGSGWFMDGFRLVLYLYSLLCLVVLFIVLLVL